MARVDEIVPDAVNFLGQVLVNFRGQVAVVRPSVPKYGVTATLPKVRRQPGERPSDALSRCWFERLGIPPEWVFPIRQVWSTPNSVSYFFAGGISSRDASVSHGATWCDPDEARQLLSASVPGPGRDRDLNALAAVTGMCLSPHRRMLEMVRELHRMGYEQLRACCYLYALGTWRCPVIPAGWTFREHGGMFRPASSINDALFANGSEGYVTYSSANDQGSVFKNFYVPDVEFASPRQLAEAFVFQRPLVAYAGRGPDPEYVRWFDRTLETLRPFGVYYAFAEFEDETDYLYTAHTECDKIPLPPPGPHPRALWENYDPKHPI